MATARYNACMVDIKYSSKNSTMETVVKIMIAAAFAVIALGLSIIVYIAITVGADRSEIMECNKIKGQAQTYSQFFMTEWQKEMCDSHGIFINAKIKNYDGSDRN